MSISSRILCVGVAAAAVSAALPAHADLKIAKAATKNVSCTGGACVATSRNAVMNVTDLATLLASQPSVSLDAGPARDITVKAGFSWTSGNSLALKASRALTVEKPVTVASKASVTIQSASMMFADKASLTFWDLGSSLTINGNAYTLVADYTGLWENVPCCQAGFVAMANDYDAANDQNIYAIDRSQGIIEGLGHRLSNVTTDDGAGLIHRNFGRISNIHVENLQVPFGWEEAAGLVADDNFGVIDHASATGSIAAPASVASGGLVGVNHYGATISNSHAKVAVGGSYVGGLVGINGGMIDSSYAEGTVGDTFHAIIAGGLVGEQWGDGGNTARITNSYSTAKVGTAISGGYYGGLIGYSLDSAVIRNSYATGKITQQHKSGAAAGGVIGDDLPQTSFANVYWDFDNGVRDPDHGAGNLPNAPGLTGLTDAQLKAGLPAGFDPKIWGQSPSINNGYPYLLANPPQ